MSSWKPESFKACEIVDKIKRNEISVPQYQRGQVWKTAQEDKLIDSIKRGYPFGTILLYKKTDSEYHLIDGLQRCTTLYRYLENPARFFNIEIDITNSVVNEIYNLIGVRNSELVIKNNIRQAIYDWVTKNNNNLSDIENIRANLCARELVSKFPSLTLENEIIIDNLLSDMFKTYKKHCKNINETPIPTIIFSGEESQLPEVFNRINSKGTILSKYQILAATWVTIDVKINEEPLFDIINYVEKFYSSIQNEGFSVANYNNIEFQKKRKVNLFQLIFGFGKLITEKYPYLFQKSNSKVEADSCGFNLINACLANRNSKLIELPNILSEQFDNDRDINKFLVNIIGCIEEVNKILTPYLKFKINSRENKINIYHTEFQICSIISNIFIKRYVTLFRDNNNEVFTRKILVNSSNDEWNKFRSDFKKSCFLNYINDVLNNSWKGSGDKRLDDISLNSDYYSVSRTKQDFRVILENWYNQRKIDRLEFNDVNEPDNQDKLLLSIIYINKFSAADQLNSSKYDIEHLFPKKLLENKLLKFQNTTFGKLPISSFGNLCLLPEWDNRKKKEKTIYQDTDYLDSIGEKIKLIESKYTFTNIKMMNWIDDDFESFDDLKSKYIDFIDSRFSIQVNEILDIIFR